MLELQAHARVGPRVAKRPPMLEGKIVRRATIRLWLVVLALSACAPLDVGDEAEALDEEESGVSSVVQVGTVLRVTASALNLRKSGSTSAVVLDVLENGAVITCIETSGGSGWVHVESEDGTQGWVSRSYVEVLETETCDPARANGAVNTFQKALHDSIAWAEGTRNYSNDGYDVMFSFKLMDSCTVHPNQCLKFGSSCSTAAGRYQFLNGTWSSVKSANGLSSFEPENQEVGAQYLIKTVRHVTVPASRAMTASEFSNAMSKLSWEWASLPPGRYGQPTRSASQMRSMYCSLAGC